MLLVRQPCVCYVLSVCEGGARCCPSRLDTWNSDAASAVALCELRRFGHTVHAVMSVQSECATGAPVVRMQCAVTCAQYGPSCSDKQTGSLHCVVCSLRATGDKFYETRPDQLLSTLHHYSCCRT
jgi:hypothetical protein